MYFKRALAALMLVALTGCSLYEGPPPPKKTDFGQGNLGCLKNFNGQLVQYFDGKSTPADVNRLADCTVKALQTFGDLVRGQNRDRFTANEVRDFLQRYFLDDVVFSDGFMRELMRVKQALIGGKETDFTQEDLKEAEGLMIVFRDILLRLQPSMPMSIDRVGRESVAYVEAETKAIADAGAIFGRRITEKDSTYSFDEMGRLFDEISRAFPGSAGTLGKIHDHLKIAGILKQMLISPDRPRSTVTAAEWRLIFEDGTRWVGNYLKYLHLQGQYPDWSRGSGRTRMNVVLNESLDLMNRVVARNCPKNDLRPSGACDSTPGIPFILIQEVIDDLEWDGSIGHIKFVKSTVRDIIAPMFQHFFSGTDLGESGRSAKRLTSNHLEHIRSLLTEWIDGSRYLEGVFAQITADPSFPENTMIPTQAILKTDVRDVLRANGGVTDAAIAVADGLRESISHTVALMDKDSPGAIFDGKNKTRDRVYRELVRYTWLRPLLKMALLGYMTEGSLTKRARQVESDGLTLPEFTVMIRDYYQLLIDFKLVAKNINTPEGDAKNRFRESSLFTQVSDGNDRIAIDEGVQLVLYLLSANPLGHTVHNRAISLCPTGGLDPYGKLTIEPQCYRTKMLNFQPANRDTVDLWTRFPLLIRFYESLDSDQRSSFAAYAESAIRKSYMKPTDYFGSSESDSLPVMFHYVEALFLRFDTNGDGFIDKSEAKVAFPIFRNTLADKSSLKPDDPKLISVFYYLLAKGRPPVDDTMGAWKKFWNSAEFLWWHITKPAFQSDRLNLLQVFATLSSASTVPAPGPSPSP